MYMYRRIESKPNDYTHTNGTINIRADNSKMGISTLVNLLQIDLDALGQRHWSMMTLRST